MKRVVSKSAIHALDGIDVAGMEGAGIIEIPEADCRRKDKKLSQWQILFSPHLLKLPFQGIFSFIM